MQVSPTHDFPAPPKDRHAQIVDAANKFEQIFTQMLVKSMRESSKISGGEGGMFGEGPGSDTYAQWFDASVSERIGDGGGLGLQKRLIEEWDRTGRTPKEVNRVA